VSPISADLVASGNGIRPRQFRHRPMARPRIGTVPWPSRALVDALITARRATEASFATVGVGQVLVNPWRGKSARVITHQKICRRYCKALCLAPASDRIFL
jgi:hypothetical protein